MKRIILISIILGFLCNLTVFGQDEKIEPRIDITYFKSGDDMPYIKVRVRKRPQRRYIPMEGVEVQAYFNEESESMSMGKITTNMKGEGIIDLPADFMQTWHDQDEFEFLVTMDETDSTEESSESLEIVKAKIELSHEKDSTIIAILKQKTEEGWIPVEYVQIKPFVKRDFGRLWVSEDYLGTDSTGTVKVKYNGDAPGNEKGQLIIGALVEDHDEFGNLIEYMVTDWGETVINDNSEFAKRSLWGARDKAPYWLLIGANLVILSVWGVIIYLVAQVFRLKKLSKLN